MYFLNLRIVGEMLSPDQLTKLFNMQPTISYEKDDVKFYRNEEIRYSEGCWLKEIELSGETDLEEAMLEFLDGFSLFKYELNKLSQDFDATIWLTVFPETEQMNLHFSSATIATIAEFGVDVDISIMSLQAFYDGSYKNISR